MNSKNVNVICKDVETDDFIEVNIRIKKEELKKRNNDFEVHDYEEVDTEKKTEKINLVMLRNIIKKMFFSRNNNDKVLGLSRKVCVGVIAFLVIVCFIAFIFKYTNIHYSSEYDHINQLHKTQLDYIDLIQQDIIKRNSQEPVIDLDSNIRNVFQKRYHNIAELPDWAQPTIRKLMENGALNGKGGYDFDLSLDMVRILVINDRLKKIE